MSSVQQAGQLDLVLRCMEEEYTPRAEEIEDIVSFSFHKMLAEIWVGSVYEILRLLKQRKLATELLPVRLTLA